MINIEELLKPISPEEPCGVDISYDPATQELETLMRGKPETQFSPAEEPRWDQVRDGCVALLRRSKSLRVAQVLCLALLRSEGVAGLRDGLAVLRGMLVEHWEGLYPRLDPEDRNDPTERVNILEALVTPLATYGDPMQFLRRLREAKLTDSKKAGRFSMEEITPSPTKEAARAVAPLDPALVQGAFQDTEPGKLAELMSAVNDSTAATKEMDVFLTNTIGADRTLDWKPLQAGLEEIRKTLAPFLPQSAATGEVAADGSVVPSAANSGAIQSREDVVRMLDRICEYYSLAEPSSPVPLILRRAQRLAAMSFIEIIEDLSPEALTSVHHVTGTKAASVPAGG